MFDEEESRRIYGSLLIATPKAPKKQYVRRSDDAERCAAVTAKGRTPCPNFQFGDSPFCTQHDYPASQYVYCGCHPTGLLVFAPDRRIIGNPPRKCLGCGIVPTIRTEIAPQDRQDPRSFPPGWNPEIPFSFKLYRLACKEREFFPGALLEIRNRFEQQEIAKRASAERERLRAGEARFERLQRAAEHERRKMEAERSARSAAGDEFDKACAANIERQERDRAASMEYDRVLKDTDPDRFVWGLPNGRLKFCSRRPCPHARHFEIANEIRAGATPYDRDHPDVVQFLRCHATPSV